MEALNLDRAADRLQQIAWFYGVVILDNKKRAITNELLPHILDALAEQANSERVFANVLPPVTEDAYIVVRWLRTKAVEVRSA